MPSGIIADVTDAEGTPTIIIGGVELVYWPAFGVYWPDPILFYEVASDWVDTLFD